MIASVFVFSGNCGFPMSNDRVFVFSRNCGFPMSNVFVFCGKLSTYNQEVVLTLNVHDRTCK